MKTQNKKLNFSKNAISELNDSQSIGVNGGCQWSNSSGPTKDIFNSFVKAPTKPTQI